MEDKKNIICIKYPNMDVYLSTCFFQSLTERPRRNHLHLCHELVCVEENGKMRFVINPPLYEHVSVDASPETVCSILFSFPKEDYVELTSLLKTIDKEVSFIDDFDGISRIRSIKFLVGDLSWIAQEKIKAELHLLFVDITRKLFPDLKVKSAEFLQTLDVERMIRIEEFFNVRLSDASCSKTKLADELGVCERQLTRILKELYNKTFSEIMMHSRMSLAEAMREKGGKSLEKIAEAVGYISVESFKRAYKNYFGKSYKKYKLN